MFFHKEMVYMKSLRIQFMTRKHLWGKEYEPFVEDRWAYDTHFLSKDWHKWSFMVIPKANIKKKSRKIVSTRNLRMWFMAMTHVWGNDNSLSSKIDRPVADIFWVKKVINYIFLKNHKWYFSVIPRLTPKIFLPKNRLHQNYKNVIMARKHMWVRNMSLSLMINRHTTCISGEKNHEWLFTTIPKANINPFFTKEWSPPKIKRCDP